MPQLTHNTQRAPSMVGGLLRIALLFSVCFPAGAQTDTEFWFVAPEVTISHQPPGGVPASFRIATGPLPATVTISQPANTAAFPDITFTIPANSFHIQHMSCFIVVPCIPLNASSIDVSPPRLENKPTIASGINDLGIRIVSNNPITVYYEVSRDNNKDIWALKGRNALGTEFYTPFQNQMGNWTGGATRAYSAIDIVAPEDNTQVTFQLPTGRQASYGSPFQPNIAAGGSHTITLNRGQTFSLFPLVSGGIISQAAAHRLHGVRITSTKPIAVSTKDDSFFHTSGGCYDLAGDQLIPTKIWDPDLGDFKDLIGREYAVIRTELNTQDNIYMLATEDNTTITIRDQTNAVVATNTINAQVQWHRALPVGQPYYRITSDKPIYVWHMGGFGCEVGGAILPPIDRCTGSTSVAFARTSAEDLYMLLMVRTVAKNNFRFMVQDTPGNFVDRSALITGFLDIPGLPWSVARIGPLAAAVVPATNHYIENTHPDDGIFHLGIVNGGASTGCFYGYFSNFNELQVSGVVAGTGSQFLYACHGQQVQLAAYGGTRYKWTQNNFQPATTLSNDAISMPMANPTTNTQYEVEVSGACNMKETAIILVQVSTPVTAHFTTDVVSGCSPMNLTFTDGSTGGYRWQYDMGDGTIYRWDLDPLTPTPPPPNPFVHTHTYTNTTTLPIERTITLLVRKADGCNDIHTKRIVVNPQIDASFTQTITGGLCANPRSVSFHNTSSFITADTTFFEFGDGFSRRSTTPGEVITHSFANSTPSAVNYQVRLIARSPFGCRDTATSAIPVYVTSRFEPSFTLGVAAGCSPLNVGVENTSFGDINPGSYLWQLFEGSTLLATVHSSFTNFTLTNLTNTTTTNRILTLRLSVNNSDGCQKVFSHDITVFPQVNASFTLPGTGSYCAGTSVTLTSTSTGPITTHTWDFGDGGSSPAPNPTYTFNNATFATVTRNVALTVRSVQGCTSTHTQSVGVFSSFKPDFAAAPARGCSPSTVSFTNNSRGPVASTYLWDFGFGPPSTSTNPGSRVFNHNPANTDSTVFLVKLDQTNEGGCMESITRPVTVFSPVTAAFTPSAIVGCNPLTVTFTNNSSSTSSVVHYSWDFGNGASSNQISPTHTFTNLSGADAVYTVRLTATTRHGCTSTVTQTITVRPFIKAEFAMDTSRVCSPALVGFSYTKFPGITTYRFDFEGDGTWDETRGAAPAGFTTRSFTNNTTAPVTLSPTLEVSNGFCTDTQVRSMTVYPRVNTTFAPLTRLVCDSTEVAFTPTLTPPLPNVTHLWDFGDGTSSIAASPRPVYRNFTDTQRDYIVTLTSTSEFGCTDSEVGTISVSPSIRALFTVDRSVICSGESITFSYTRMGGISNFAWNFVGYTDNIKPADSPLGTFVKNFVNITNAPMNVTVRLTVTNSNPGGCPEVFELPITINPAINPSFTWAPLAGNTLGCTPLGASFTNGTTFTGGGAFAGSYQWDFGDGASSVLANPTHTFTNSSSTAVASYTVNLTAISVHGCRANAPPRTVVVQPRVQAGFTMDAGGICSPRTVSINPTSSIGASQYRWHWDWNINTTQDSLLSSSAPFSRVFASGDPVNSQVFTVALITEAASGCRDTLTRNLMVHPLVRASIAIAPPASPTGCSRHTVTFTNNSVGTNITYLWNFGNGQSLTTTTTAAQTHTFTNRGTIDSVYNVVLTATSPSGCVSRDSIAITVRPGVEASFAMTHPSVCTPFEVTFTNTSLNANRFVWDYGYTLGGVSQGAVLTTLTPHTHTFANEHPEDIRTYTITLTAQNTVTGCTSTLSRTLEVYPRVVANFSPNFTNRCSGSPFTLSNSSTGGNLTFEWDFGDGRTATTTTRASVAHTFENRGASDRQFTIRLLATNPNGCTSTHTQLVTVHPKVEANFTFRFDSVCTPYQVQFNNESLNGREFTWDFGHMGRTRFDTNKNPFTQEFDNPDPNTIRTYTISLLADDPVTGCRHDTTRTITVYPRVVANVTPNIPMGCSDHLVSFTNSSTGGANAPGAGLVFTWNFGDGQTAVTNGLAARQHTFINRTTDDVTRNVVVTATNPNGCFNSQVIPITTHPKVEASFTFAHDSVCTPYNVVFTNNSLNGTTFDWNYGYTLLGVAQAGQTTRPQMTHTYTFDNDTDNTILTPTITLRAWRHHAVSNQTCQDIATRSITVNPRVVANITPNIPMGCSDHLVNFTNSSTGGANAPGAGLVFTWNFGDGQTAVTNGLAPRQHTFINRTTDDVTRNVVVTATNPNGCFNSQVIPITTHPKVEASFTFAHDSVCTPYNVVFTNNSLNGTTFDWNYGYTLLGVAQAGQTTRPQMTHTYTFDNDTDNTILTPTITLRAWRHHAVSNQTCQDIATRSITVYPRVVARFAPSTLAGCNPLDVSFANTSTGLATYTWALGDSLSSVNPTPRITFAHPHRDRWVDYPITLTATNVNGCKSVATSSIRVYPLVKAGYTLSRVEGCTPLSVTVANTSTSGQYRYAWTYGDGRPGSTNALPGTAGVIQYVNSTRNTPSIQTPNLRLITYYHADASCADTIVRRITVFPHVYPQFTGNFQGCHPHTVNFTNTTDVFPTGTTQYLWNLGKGITRGGSNPSAQTYRNVSKTANDVTPVTLHVTSPHGCTDSVTHNVTVYPQPQAKIELQGEHLRCPPFVANFNNLSLGTNLTYTYNFGGLFGVTRSDRQPISFNFGNTSDVTQPYVVRVEAVSEFGCRDTDSQTIYVYPEVTAQFNFNPGPAACNPYVVNMTNTSTNAWHYSWNFDDGTTSNLASPTHRFVNYTNQDRQFNVNLTAISEFDCEQSLQRELTVYAAPIAAFAIDPPLKVFPDATFVLENLTQPAHPSWQYQWDFGDGYGSNQMHPGSYTYRTWGPIDKSFVYRILLRVSNNNCWDTISHNAILRPAEPMALFNSMGNVYESCSPLEVYFENTSVYGHSYLWDFGDGTTSTEVEPSHIFTAPGYYNVMLTSFGDGGASNYYRVFRVFRNPIARFEVEPDRVLLPDPKVHFFNLSEYADTYQWDLGDGTISHERDPVHIYPNELAEYNVTLTVFTKEGCWDQESLVPGVWVEGRGRIQFPNAFVPSVAGPSGGFYDEVDFRNVVFHPAAEGVAEYRLEIYNRWGERIFESRDIRVGWDGYYNGKLCDQGVYVWRARGRFTNGKLFDKRGNVTLLR